MDGEEKKLNNNQTLHFKNAPYAGIITITRDPLQDFAGPFNEYTLRKLYYQQRK